MKIKAIVFGSDGISEHVIDKLHYRCHHNFKANFLSFGEPLLFKISNERRRKNRSVELRVSQQMKAMFIYEDSIFSKILEAIPKLTLKKKYTSARELAWLLQNIDPVNYGKRKEVNLYEVKFKGFLCHLAMGFYTSPNNAPPNFTYTSMMLWDRYKPIFIHINDLGKFVNYLLDHSYFYLETKTTKGNKMVEMKIKWRDNRY